jgi:hypothetical protein
MAFDILCQKRSNGNAASLAFKLVLISLDNGEHEHILQQLSMSQKTGSPESQHSPGRIFYGWYIVAAGTISSFVNMAVFMVGLSIFIKDLRDEMGWTLTAISIGFSL